MRIDRTRTTILLSLPFVVTAFCALAAAQRPATRKPIPDDQELARATSLFGEVYGQEIDGADTSDKKLALSKRLLSQSIQTRNAPADQYVLMREAERLAAAAGDAQAALSAVDLMGERFDVDVWEVRVQAIQAVAAEVKFTSQKKSLAAAAAELVDGAIKADRFEPAASLAAIALDAARGARDGPLLQQIAASKKDLDIRKEAYGPVPDALAVLVDQPLDAAANRIVGDYRCVWKGDWDRGIAMLALGDDPTLKELAASELRSSGSPDEMAALGDRWWDLGEKADGHRREVFLQRAGYWYEQSLPGLSGGLTKIKIEKRLDEVAQLAPASAAAEAAATPDQMEPTDWEPVGPAGELTRCHVLGPFSQSQLDFPVVNFIRKAQPGRDYTGRKLEPMVATSDRGLMRFAGSTEPGSKMYYVFHFRTEQNQNVQIQVHAPGKYNEVNLLLNYVLVRNLTTVPLKRGSTHVLIVKLDHNRGDTPDQSWIALSLRGAESPILQWK